MFQPLHLILLIICVLILRYLWNKRKFYYLSWKLPGPIAFPFIGNAWMFLNSSRDVMNIISTEAQKFGSPVRFWLGTRFLVYIHSPQHIETVINSEIPDKGDVCETIHDFIGGHGLLSLNGDVWKAHRKLLNPSVQHYSILNSFNSSFNKNNKILINKLENRVENGAFNIYEYIQAATAEIVCNTIFGVEMDLQHNQNKDFLNAVNNGTFLVGLKILEPWYQYKLIMRFSKYHEMNKNSTSVIRKFVKNIYTQKLIESGNGNMLENIVTHSDEFGVKRVRSFIEECIRLTVHQQCFTENDTINESITMLIGGFETTAGTVSNIILMLAMHPQYQEKVYDEINNILPASKTTVTTDVINQLYYLDCFIKETLRLFPTVTFLSRIARNEMKIGKYNVPIGTELILSVFDLHRSESIWGPNATKFNPDNFLSENIKGKHSHSFIPFASGVRNCIGYRYANIVVRLMVASLVRNFLFTTDLKYDELRLKWAITLKLENGHIVHLAKRSLS